jgi:tRNA/rRNA methyltransferase
MLNCGLTDLRLVRPRDGWPNQKARAAASGADSVIDGARLYDRLEDAIAGFGRVYATTARTRDMIKPVMTPRRAAADLRAEIGQGVACGLLFGRERSGLDNDEVALADTIVQVPLNPAYSSLSLPQAVLLLAYEWYQAGSDTPPEELATGRAGPAGKEELLYFFERLEAMLEAANFFPVEDKRPTMVRNIRNLFQRNRLTDQELRTLHGILSAFDPERGKGGG